MLVFQGSISLLFTEPSLIAEENLQNWQTSNSVWLEMSEVRRQTTNNIRITVAPFYWGIKV